VVIPQETKSALRRLADAYRSGKIYVTTTARLLTYCLAHRTLDWSCEVGAEDHVTISVMSVDDPLFGSHEPTEPELQGITFYVPRSDRASVAIGGRKPARLVRNPKDETGRESVSIQRTFLTYPE
jgi:hypothetical protein